MRSNRINRTILKIIPAGFSPAGFFFAFRAVPSPKHDFTKLIFLLATIVLKFSQWLSLDPQRSLQSPLVFPDPSSYMAAPVNPDFLPPKLRCRHDIPPVSCSNMDMVLSISQILLFSYPEKR
ncbi:hypothetical protein AAK899_03935 [Erysipelotrichaceae bacterium 51-3]|nr:hypothetical protein [Allobaculum sp. JKK-2023]